MRGDIRVPKIATKPRFKNANFKFYHELIPRAAKGKEYQHENNMKGTKV